jgi:hypothetical protein
MTTSKRSTKLSAVEAVAGDRDLMKALMKEALQEVQEGEMTEFLSSPPSITNPLLTVGSSFKPAQVQSRISVPAVKLAGGVPVMTISYSAATSASVLNCNTPPL